MNKKVLVTLGPIPAKLDSVKYITNRFKGRLSFKTAVTLAEKGYDVTIAHWKYADIDFMDYANKMRRVLIEDVEDYMSLEYMDFDAYILSAAVANLMPSNPYIGKFPSHNYQEGERFNIEFEIAPRLIDKIKRRDSRRTLIGYKLFDGTDEQLIDAGWKTLIESKANVIFCNKPSSAVSKKIAITPDGNQIPMNFDEHVSFIIELLKQEWYQTRIMRTGTIVQFNLDTKWLSENYLSYEKEPYYMGTWAQRNNGNSFFTTIRGKDADALTRIAFVVSVDHENKVVQADKKATLDAPLLSKLFELNPHINYLIHIHGKINTDFFEDNNSAICNFYNHYDQYKFPGTAGEVNFHAKAFTADKFIMNQPHHGYMAGFKNFIDCKKFILEQRMSRL